MPAVPLWSGVVPRRGGAAGHDVKHDVGKYHGLVASKDSCAIGVLEPQTIQSPLLSMTAIGRPVIAGT